MTKTEFFNAILPPKLIAKERASAYAPANIALAKYWGKRDRELNLPISGSLSLSLGELGTTTTITAAASDQLTLNGEPLPITSNFAQKVFAFVDLFRRDERQPLKIDTTNTIPTAAGLASSASGFAALTLALADFWQLGLDKKTLSSLARIGSGSAARSLWHGFVKWECGTRSDGADSYAQPLETTWQTLRFALLEISTSQKHTASGAGMIHTAQTSPLFSAWEKTASEDLQTIEDAILTQDFTLLGQTAEANALAMHATMLAARPALNYFLPQTLVIIAEIQAARAQGFEIYFTMDAGPNVKVLFQASQEDEIKRYFPNARIINPFMTQKVGQQNE